jgi:nucleoside-diphosphate-sugar epimerase
MNILITGTNGYIGKHLSQVSPYDVTCLHRGVCDLTDKEEVDNFFGQFGKFDVVIHCAAVGGSRLKNDEDDIFHSNVQMFLNLVRNKDSFDRLIHFGSGAQRFDNGPYGFSKRVIANMIEELDNFYNIIIYGLFDENEIDTRFIKSCVNNCLNKTSIDVNDNKTMDFFHMRDLESVVNHYVSELNPPKTIECSYSDKFTLIQLAHAIRDLCQSNVRIEYGGGEEKLNYSGKNTNYLNKIIKGNFRDRLEQNIKKLRGIEE